MALNDTQLDDAMRSLIQEMFVRANATATFTTANIKAAMQALDQAFDLTLTQAGQQVGTGNISLRNFLIQSLPEPFKSSSTAGQKALLVAFWAMKTGGVI